MSEIVWSIEPGRGVGPFQLGASRADVIRAIERAELTVEDDPDEPQWLYVDEIDAELTFSDGPSPVLIEISCSDEQLRFGPIDLIDEPVIKIVELLKVSDDETVWTLPPEETGDAANATKAEGGEAEVVASPSVEKLLKDGTLWIRPFGLGLELVLGDIFNVRLRRPGDIPPVAVGPMTAEQRLYAAHPELTSKLLDSMPSSGRPAEKSGLQCLGGVALIVALGIIVWRAVDLQQRWNSAPDVEAVVIGTNPPPPVDFPDEYTVSYTDLNGARHEVALKQWEVYGLPEIGAKLELRYLPEEPDKPMSPAKYRDAGVSEYLPGDRRLRRVLRAAIRRARGVLGLAALVDEAGRSGVELIPEPVARSGDRPQQSAAPNEEA